MSSLITDEPEVLSAIVDSSVRNNKLRGITGMLLYSDGNVVQVLEGPKEAVRETFQAIQTDNRHQGMFVLIEGEIAARNFASWSMGYKQLSAADLEKFPAAANLFKVHHDTIGILVQPGEALTVLKSFAEG